VKTPGALIRALIPAYYPNSHELNLAVNEHRRQNGFKNWYAAAADLLTKHEEKSDVHH
jgi:capsule polysaccharide modification protein KpsS